MRATVRWTAAALILAGIVAFYTRVVRVNATTAAMTLLLLTLVLAAYWGVRFAVTMSIVAALCFNFFFLPPVGAFVITGGQNWLAFFAFLATALIGSNLSYRVKVAAAASDRRRRELEFLYDFGQRLLFTDSTADLLKVIPQSIVVSFLTRSAALYLVEGDRVYFSDGDAVVRVRLEELRNAVHAPYLGRDLPDHKVLLPLTVGVRPIGSVRVEGNLPSQETLEAMSGLIAISIERAGAVEKLARSDAGRESERLRSTLLDSVTHDLRTPLTSIKASVSSLISQETLTAAQRAELLTVIDEESDRLNVLIAQAVEMARLDAHEVQLELEPCDVKAVIQGALEAGSNMLAKRKVEVRLAQALPPVLIDALWIQKVLGHLLENATKYSAPDQPIFVSAEKNADLVTISIADRGIGIDPMEQSMIFDKFYRGQNHRYKVHGTGMGLAISKAIVEEHDGTLSVTSRPGNGSVFSFTLPVAPLDWRPEHAEPGRQAAV